MSDERLNYRSMYELSAVNSSSGTYICRAFFIHIEHNKIKGVAHATPLLTGSALHFTEAKGMSYEKYISLSASTTSII